MKNESSIWSTCGIQREGEATLNLGLLEEDDPPNLCLTEACEVQMTDALRRLFATLLVFGQPSDPPSLWSKFYSSLSEDFSHKFPDNKVKVRVFTASSIEKHLEALGKSLLDFGLNSLNVESNDEFRRTKDIIDALDAPIPQEYGPGGTGKTFLYNALYAKIRLMKKIVLPTATSGIAAANIPSGRTAHSRFKIPIDSEASLAYLCENTLLFGGKIVVFGGDFKQVLPIVPRKTQREAVETSIGNGELQQTEFGYVQLPPNIVRSLAIDSDLVKELIAVTFLEIGTGSFSTEIFTECAILTPMKDDVDSINTFLIDHFPGDPVVYKSFDCVLDDMCTVYPTEFINKLCPGGMSPHVLVLKEILTG
ncbi:uncharacterized protein LOC110700208 [Chenopodium quinoa]|uniref:uncharacterized protein LOC110700208 n=1 Tax=Chenopodium quinoa TaxID=63459 RepID=UPI000B77421B|nr:uncharacterized protein LOC110700208 [Chenopodium quinoa]